MHGIDKGELEIEPFRLLRQFSTLLLSIPEDRYVTCVFDKGVNRLADIVFQVKSDLLH